MVEHSLGWGPLNSKFIGQGADVYPGNALAAGDGFSTRTFAPLDRSMNDIELGWGDFQMVGLRAQMWTMPMLDRSAAFTPFENNGLASSSVP